MMLKSIQKRAGRVIMASHCDPFFHRVFFRTAKITAYAEGKKRSLVIRKCDVEDSARITARTNVDETGTIFMVKCKFADLNLKSQFGEMVVILSKSNLIVYLCMILKTPRFNTNLL